MGFTELCIRRPVFATVLSLVLVLAGLMSFSRLTIREYPNIDEPQVSVQTNYPGASAEIIESQVTQVLEGSLAGIEGIDTIESTSRAEQSRITIRFRSTVAIDAATSDVRDRVSRVRRQLPDEITEPTISKVEADAQPIMFLVTQSDTMDAAALTDYVDRFVVNRFKNLDGVADVQVNGERTYAMRVWIDAARLAGQGLTVQDVETAIRNQNADIPAGRIESLDREFTVLSKTALGTAEEFSDIVLKEGGGLQVRLRDVARVELGTADVRRESRYNGVTAISIGIVKTAVANPLDVASEVKALLPRLNGELPKGTSITVGFDSTVFIDRSIDNVFKTILEAIGLVLLIILLFLHSFRAAVIPVVTIPVSLIATFAIMYATGLTVNTLTLLAMVLAIGLVVDDAIVVLENIYRHIEEGMKPFDAAIRGAREIGFAVIAMTLTLAAVYAPIAFTPGRTGRLFMEFAVTLAGAVIVSGFVALTLTPMMCSKLLKHSERRNIFARLIEGMLDGLERGYRAMLSAALTLRWLVLLLALGVGLSGGWLFTQMKSELSPTEDRGTIIINASAPEGASFGYTQRYASQAEELLAQVPELQSYLMIVGPGDVTQFLSFARLRDWAERDVSQQQVVQQLSPRLRKIAGVQAFATNPASLGVRGFGKPFQFVIQSSASYEELNALAQKLVERLKDNPGLTDLDTDMRLNKPEVEIEIDRARVADLGLDISVIGRTLETLLGGRNVTTFQIGSQQYDVTVALPASERTSPETLANIFVRGKNGEMVQLSNIVTAKVGVAPRDLRRFNQLRAITIQANLAPGYTLGEAIAAVDQAAAEVLPQGTLTDLTGQAREFRDASSNLALVFVMALAFIYLVLSAQFESFRDPLMIMVSVPLSMTGALGALWLTGGTLNVYSQIGLVTLIGLITKHGILIVDFANKLQLDGMERRQAILEAARLRLRPILMTTAAMILGAIPLALATGAGAESRQQIGWVIVGGMSLGTLLTLFVVPCVYAVMGWRPKPGGAPQVAAPHPAE
ncbi:multidrug transporter AcrB [Aestuariivirga litoralis]|uniref:Multidrug transporter AcrB n=1 Tax=Aestuariivirga litoralis TaxID=2650924 RepID=A0A2W2AX64_9HYPH|nr:efflux RND transporter permease subunit [Aestuariivirga litoralis]PZF77220.1 multidrug transporter AcrB [Aestuariivirga litoralis]